MFQLSNSSCNKCYVVAKTYEIACKKKQQTTSLEGKMQNMTQQQWRNISNWQQQWGHCRGMQKVQQWNKDGVGLCKVH